MTFDQLNSRIVTCTLCPRLRSYCISTPLQLRAVQGVDYWNKPVPGFGDFNAKILICGLAPGAHGANRTGRPFTGDFAGDKLFAGLYRSGLANQLSSLDNDDGLELTNVYITNVVRCAPPHDKPSANEIDNCRSYLQEEYSYLSQVKLILCLGRISFHSVLRFLKLQGMRTSGLRFTHGTVYNLGGESPLILASYHTSKRNYRRGIMNDEMLDEIIRTAIKLIG